MSSTLHVSFQYFFSWILKYFMSQEIAAWSSLLTLVNQFLSFVLFSQLSQNFEPLLFLSRSSLGNSFLTIRFFLEQTISLFSRNRNSCKKSRKEILGSKSPGNQEISCHLATLGQKKKTVMTRYTTEIPNLNILLMSLTFTLTFARAHTCLSVLSTFFCVL